MSEEKTNLITEVEGTPFVVIEQDKNFHVVLNKYSVDKCATKEEAFESAKSITWDKISLLIGLAMEYNNNKGGEK